MAKIRFIRVICGLAFVTTCLATLSGVATATGTKPTYEVSFRPVLCFAPRLELATPVKATTMLPPCGSTYRLTAKNLRVMPANNVDGYTSRSIGPDPAFRSVANTSKASVRLNSDALLPGVAGSNAGQRYVVGPAGVTSSTIRSAAVKKASGQWVVDYQLTKSGTTAWNLFAEREFHEFVAIVADGKVYSAPLILPAESTFTSFSGSGEIEANLSKSEAEALAEAMTHS